MNLPDGVKPLIKEDIESMDTITISPERKVPMAFGLKALIPIDVGVIMVNGTQWYVLVDRDNSKEICRTRSIGGAARVYRALASDYLIGLLR